MLPASDDADATEELSMATGAVMGGGGGRKGGRKVTCGERKFKKWTRVSEAQLFESHYIVIIRNVSISRH